MKGHSTKSCYAKNNLCNKSCSSTNQINMGIDQISMFILQSNGSEYVDCPKRFEVQGIL
jgi:hypothetical protein